MAIIGALVWLWYINTKPEPAMLSPGDLTQISPDTSQPTDDWQTPFNALYSLKPGEIVKHTPTPFIRERLEFYRQTYNDQFRSRPFAPDFMLLAQSDAGQFSLHSSWFMDGHGRGWPGVPLRRIIAIAGRMPLWQVEGDPTLLSKLVEGDWVVREGAGAEQILPQVEIILSGFIGRQITLSHQRTEREVVTATGKFNFTKPPTASNPLKIEFPLTSKQTPIHNMGGVPYLFQLLYDSTGTPFLDNRDTRDYVPMMMDSSAISVGDKTNDQILDHLLATLSTQTGLTFHREKRMVDIWTLTPAIASTKP